MNANELADLMEDMYPSVATMLRQQQAEIEAVKESNKNLMELVTMLREEVNSLRQQQAEIEALKEQLDCALDYIKQYQLEKAQEK